MCFCFKMPQAKGSENVDQASPKEEQLPKVPEKEKDEDVKSEPNDIPNTDLEADSDKVVIENWLSTGELQRWMEKLKVGHRYNQACEWCHEVGLRDMDAIIRGIEKYNEVEDDYDDFEAFAKSKKGKKKNYLVKFVNGLALKEVDIDRITEDGIDIYQKIKNKN